MSVAHGDLRPVEVQIEDVPHPDVRNVINECLQFQGNKRLTFNAIEHRLKIALDECKKKERRRIKDVKKERRIKRREDEARKKAKHANDAKEQRVAEEKNVTAIDVKPIESGGQEMDSTSQQDTELRLLLNKNNIGRFYDKLVAEGIRSKEDLVHLTLEDLTEWGMGRFEARKAVAAVRRLVDTGVIEGQ